MSGQMQKALMAALKKRKNMDAVDQMAAQDLAQNDSLMAQDFQEDPNQKGYNQDQGVVDAANQVLKSGVPMRKNMANDAQAASDREAYMKMMRLRKNMSRGK